MNKISFQVVVSEVPYISTYLLPPYLLDEPIFQDGSLNQLELWDLSPLFDASKPIGGW